MSFVSNGGKFKLYTVLNGLIFPTPTKPRISFELPILKTALPEHFHKEIIKLAKSIILYIYVCSL
jgi:hypothetical protein